MRLCAYLAGILAFGASVADGAAIRVDRTSLVRDAPSLIRIVPDSPAVLAGSAGAIGRAGDPSGWTVYVEYFPNSNVMRDDTLGVTGSDGVLSWTPDYAGIVSIQARRGEEAITENVSVKYPSVPVGAVVVFFVAGTILFGGAGWSLIRLAEHNPPDGLDDDEAGA